MGRLASREPVGESCDVGPAIAVEVGDRDHVPDGGEGRECRPPERAAVAGDVDRHGVSVPSGGGEVGLAVAVQVGDCQIAETRNRRAGSLTEVARAVAQPDPHAVRQERGQIGLAVPVEVADGDVARAPPRSHGRGPAESTRAVPAQDRDLVPLRVRKGDVRLPVAVEVGNGDGDVRGREDRHRRAGCFGEAARAVAEQDLDAGDAPARGHGHDQVRPVIAVHVCGDDAPGCTGHLDR
jgi:hypothetical protein